MRTHSLWRSTKRADRGLECLGKLTNMPMLRTHADMTVAPGQLELSQKIDLTSELGSVNRQ